MKLIVGLGNPGDKYDGTRHNVGYEVLSVLAARWLAEPPRHRFSGHVQEVFVGGQKVLLLAPLTWMNRSGEAVQPAARFFQIATDDMVVICDDMNLPPGRLRWRASGSAGGQNGLDDIIRRLGTNAIPRLRIGIGRPTGRRDATSWVLGRFSPQDRELVDVAVSAAADSVDCWVRDGIAAAMNRFNATGRAEKTDGS